MFQAPVPAHPLKINLEVPIGISLQVTAQQFEDVAVANRDLKLERTAAGELIVNPPTGGESGKRNRKTGS